MWARDASFEINSMFTVSESMIVDKISQDVCGMKRDRPPSIAFPFSS